MSENEWPADTDPIVVEAVSSLDREVFEANPDLDQFVRPMALGEGPVRAKDVRRHVVRVVLLGPGARAREFRHGWSSREIREAFERAVTERVARMLAEPRETAS
jgi:hypothetical protein